MIQSLLTNPKRIARPIKLKTGQNLVSKRLIQRL